MSVYKAIHGVLADLSKIGISKDKTNQQQGFKYRGIDSVMDTVSSLLAKHGLLILPRVTKREIVERQSAKGNALFYTTLEVEYDFIGVEDGSKHTVGPIIGEAMDSGDKSSNKAMSIAFKYACFEAFCIPLEGDNDPDSQTHDVKPHAWDGKVQVGFSKNYKDSLWRDVPKDFLDWCNDPNNKLSQKGKEYARLEKERRESESRQFNQEMPESFYQGTQQ